MREFINKYGYVVVGVCVVVAVAVWFFTRSGNNFGRPDRAFYIDDVTGEESIQPQSEVPPLLNKDGNPTLVKVIKVSCNGGKSPHVAYYEKYTDEAQAKIKSLTGTNDPAHDAELQDAQTNGELIRLPVPGSPWVHSNTPEGEKVRDAAMCNNGQPTIAVYPQ